MYRNTWVEVNLDSIYDNVKTTKDICKKKIYCGCESKRIWKW